MNYYKPILSKKFIELTVKSGKWKKWMIDKNSSDLHKTYISGHYVYSSIEGMEIISELKQFLNKKKIDLNEELKKAIRSSILRYLKNFRLI